MNLERARLLWAFGGLAVWFGCSHRSTWMHDESHRIDESLKAEKFSPQLPGAVGTAVEAAVPVASAPTGRGYSLEALKEKKRREPRRAGKAKTLRAKGTSRSAVIPGPYPSRDGSQTSAGAEVAAEPGSSLSRD